MKKHNVIIAVVVIVLIVCIGSITIISRDKTPDISDQGPEEIQAYSDPNDAAVQDPNQQGQLGGKTIRELMTLQAKKYFESTPKEKIAILDGTIDRMEEMRKERREQSEEPPQRPEGVRQRRIRNPETTHEQVEPTDPLTRAQMSQFMNALRQRMEQRNIDSSHFSTKR